MMVDQRAVLVVVGASANMARAAVKLPCELVFVGRETPGLRDVIGPQGVVVQCDLSDLGDLEDQTVRGEVVARLRALVRDRTAAVVAVSEAALLPALALRESLEARGTPREVVDQTVDKARMREVLARDLPRHNVAHTAAEDHEGVQELLRHGPVIVKPRSGTGSHNVRRVGTWDAFVDLDQSIRRGAQVEEFADGIEVTVETLSIAGRHEVFGVAEKFVDPNFVELGHVMPPPSLTAEALDEVVVTVHRLLGALRIDNVVSCTEAIWSPRGVKVVETHTRLGGDGLADLIEATTGVDWRQTALGAPLGIRPVAGAARAQAAAMVFFTAPAGVVEETMPMPPVLPGVTFEYWKVDCGPGDTVGKLRSSNDRLGSGRLTASSSETCRGAVMKLLGSGVVRTTASEVGVLDTEW